MTEAEEVMRSPQELFTIALESLDRQIADMQDQLRAIDSKHRTGMWRTDSG